MKKWTANSLAIIIPDDQTVALKIMSHQKKLEPYEEMTDYRFREKYKMNPRFLIVQESKDAFRDKWGHVKTTQKLI